MLIRDKKKIDEPTPVEMQQEVIADAILPYVEKPFVKTSYGIWVPEDKKVGF